MMSAHNSTANVKECLRHGSSDYLVKPVNPDDLVNRLVLHMQKKRQIREASSNETTESGIALHYMHLTDLLMREGLKLAPAPTAIYNILGMLGLATGAVRVSAVEADATFTQATVRGSNDKKDIDGFVIDLVKYPEIVFVLRSKKLLALDNLKNDPTMAAIATQTKSISFNAMVVCPICLGGEVWGALSVRLPETKTSLSDFEIRFAQLTAHVIGSIVARSTKSESDEAA
jgi:GAF domain-containing protein